MNMCNKVIENIITHAKAAYKYPSAMEIYGIERNETRHTRFLAWLLSPQGIVLKGNGNTILDNADHGLGNKALIRFLNLQSNLNNGEADNLQKSWNEGRLENYSIKVITEWNNIDLLVIGKCRDKSEKHFVVALEAKINHTETQDNDGVYQTTSYYNLIHNHGEFREYRQVYYFLTAPGSRGPRNDRVFQHITYQHILNNIIEPLINNEEGNEDSTVKKLIQYRRCLSIPRSSAFNERFSKILGVSEQEGTNLDEFFKSLCPKMENWGENGGHEFKLYKHFIVAAVLARRAAGRNDEDNLFNNPTFTHRVQVAMNDTIPSEKLLNLVTEMRSLQEEKPEENANSKQYLPPTDAEMHSVCEKYYKWNIFENELNRADFPNPVRWIYTYIHQTNIQLDIKIGGTRQGNEQKWEFAEKIYRKIFGITEEDFNAAGGLGLVKFDNESKKVKDVTLHGMKSRESHHKENSEPANDYTKTWNEILRGEECLIHRLGNGIITYRYNTQQKHDATIIFTPQNNNAATRLRALEALNELLYLALDDANLLANANQPDQNDQ